MALTFDDIKTEFMTKVDSDKTVQSCLRTIHDGRGTYETANRLAKRVGETLGKVLKSHEPIENIDEWDYVNLIPQSLGLNQQIIVDACRDVQNGLNKKNGFGIKYEEPKFDWNRINGLIDELRNNPEFHNIEKSFYDQLVNFSENIVDDSIRDNVGRLYRSGIRTMIVRQAEFRACEWCREVAGSYDYAEVRNTGNDVWRRHENCHCIIDYVTEKDSGFYSERVNNQKKS
jgi:hypothetical protein